LHPAHQHPVVNYTYNEYVPYKVRVKVSYMKPYTVKVRTPVKTYYYKKGKYRVRYVYSYSYVTRYRKDYKWVTETRYKKVSRVGYAKLGDYLQETDNCQVSDDEIVSLSQRLTANATSVYEKAVNIFTYVRDNTDYSFYYNTRYGAIGTLRYRTANCCDHTPSGGSFKGCRDTRKVHAWKLCLQEREHLWACLGTAVYQWKMV